MGNLLDLTGEFKPTLDDKGRVSLPSSMRDALPGTVLRLTKGRKNKCLELIPLDEWEGYVGVLTGSLADNLAESLNPSSSLVAKKREALRLRVIAPSHQVEIDRVGRIAIPPDLREFAGLTLGEACMFVGLGNYIQIWEAGRYREYYDAMMAVLENEDEVSPAE